MFHQRDSEYGDLSPRDPGSPWEAPPWSSGGVVASVACDVGRGRERRPTRRVLRWVALAVHLALAGLVATGCAKARAASVPQAPPLTVPEPPARVLAPIVEETPLVASPGPDSLVSAPSLPSSPPRPQRRAVPAVSESSAPESTPAAATPSSSPAVDVPRDLRPAPSSREAVADRQRVQGVIDKAERDLGNVDWGRLSAQGKEDYDQSARSRIQAAAALKEGNLLRAGEAAEKAARLAAALLAGQ